MLNLAEYRKKPHSLADFLPWAALVAEGVVLNKDGSFQLRLDRGTWRIRAFRDLNSDRSWQPARERASDLVSVEVEAAGLVSDLKLTLRPAPGGP